MLLSYEFNWKSCWLVLWEKAKAHEADWDKSELLTTLMEIERTEMERLNVFAEPKMRGRPPICTCGVCNTCKRRVQALKNLVRYQRKKST